LHIECSQLEVCGGDIGHESRNNFLAGPFSRKKICSRGFRCAAKLAPEIEFPNGRRIHLARARFKCWEERGLGRATIGNRRSSIQCWKLISARDPELCPGFENSRRCYAQVIVLLQCSADQR